MEVTRGMSMVQAKIIISCCSQTFYLSSFKLLWIGYHHGYTFVSESHSVRYVLCFIYLCFIRVTKYILVGVSYSQLLPFTLIAKDSVLT